ncbi:MAG: tetratricopeptide repeat protein [Armatimonadetes bacterium]|nr:tetratricopeptide repeat protein [Armatimonadota bacterium]
MTRYYYLFVFVTLSMALGVTAWTYTKQKEERLETVKVEVKNSMAAEEWFGAEKGLREIWKAEPDCETTPFMLGLSLHYQEKFDEAREMFLESYKRGYKTALSQYNIACGYALSGEKDLAVQYLEKAFELDYSNVEFILDDADLDSLHDREDFKNLLERMEKRQHEKDAAKGKEIVDYYNPDNL